MPYEHENRWMLSQSLPVRMVRRALEATVAIIVFSYAMIICTQVFYRYALNSSLIWSEELVRFGLLWGVMLGGAIASDRFAHVALDPLRGAISDNAYRIVAWCAGILVIVFCAITAWYGSQYAFRIRFMSSPASQIPMIYVYAAIPVGCVLMAFFTIVQLFSGNFGANSSDEELLV
ncbi:TRAP transporter small permease [Arvimicrobium flavum]|uniref:TRAP transporter small permease n=1 Tax=Arvimicrobium flavum TaxID=3393320 RepID=UPI00237BAE99|nr:TRAP transporter small permease [Mesorhizobium shangrilense]